MQAYEALNKGETIMKRAIALILALVLILAAVPVTYAADCVDAADHTYENGICTGCGEEEPAYAPR